MRQARKKTDRWLWSPTERFFALLAHAIGPLTILLKHQTGNLRWLLLIGATLGIYGYFSRQSPFVTHHARQAFALQVLGAVAWVTLVAVGAVGGVGQVLLLAISVVILLGLLIIPSILLSQPGVVGLSLVLPLSGFVFGCLGVWRIAHGQDLDYPVLADWLDHVLGVCYERR